RFQAGGFQRYDDDGVVSSGKLREGPDPPLGVVEDKISHLAFLANATALPAGEVQLPLAGLAGRVQLGKPDQVVGDRPAGAVQGDPHAGQARLDLTGNAPGGELVLRRRLPRDLDAAAAVPPQNEGSGLTHADLLRSERCRSKPTRHRPLWGWWKHN